MVWYDMVPIVWYGTYGMVWHGMVWYLVCLSFGELGSEGEGRVNLSL